MNLISFFATRFRPTFAAIQILSSLHHLQLLSGDQMKEGYSLCAPVGTGFSKTLQEHLKMADGLPSLVIAHVEEEYIFTVHLPTVETR